VDQGDVDVAVMGVGDRAHQHRLAHRARGRDVDDAGAPVATPSSTISGRSVARSDRGLAGGTPSSSWQVAEQPSAAIRLPSSQLSPGSV
jgi:hypothetical protein